MRRNVRFATAFAAVSAVTVSGVRAQGFSVNEHDACAMGRGGATVARPCPGGPAAWFNPAGLVDMLGMPGIQASLGLTLIKPTGGFTDDLSSQKTDLGDILALVPNAYVRWGLKPELALGLSVTAPYGLEIKWPTTFNGRFAAYQSALHAIYIQPTVAYDLMGILSLGAGLDIVVSSVDLSQRADAGATLSSVGVPLYTDFADVDLSASGTGVGFNVGAQVKFWERFAVGFRYLHRVKVSYDGDATFAQLMTGIVLPANNPLGPQLGLGTGPLPLDLVLADQFQPGGPLSAGKATTEITLPGQWQIGVAWNVIDRLTLFGDYHRQNWNVFDTLTLDFENSSTPDITLVEDYRDSHGVRLGGEYAVSATTLLRAGYLWHSAATPAATVTPLLPEGERQEFTAGIGFGLMQRLRADVAYQFLLQANRRGRIAEAPEGVNGATLNSGLYEFKGHLFGANLTYSF
jgi:long-chain fatty acid transport protein